MKVCFQTVTVLMPQSAIHTATEASHMMVDIIWNSRTPVCLSLTLCCGYFISIMRWWSESGKLCRIPASAVNLRGLKGQASLHSLVLKASVSTVNWLGSGRYPTHCITLPFTNPSWPLKMEASINTIHCAPFYTRRGQKFSLQVLTVKAELWTCDLLEWVGRGGRAREKKKDRGEGSSFFNAEWLELQLHADCIASTAEYTW